MDLSIEAAKELILNEKQNSINNAVDIFTKVQTFTAEDLNSIGVLINEAKTNLNYEGIMDMHKIIAETMKSLYHLDMAICDLFTLDRVVEIDKIIRLYSAFELMQDYDNQYQASLEDQYEKMG